MIAKMINKHINIFLSWSIMLVMIFLVSCGSSSDGQPDNKYRVFYPNDSYTMLQSDEKTINEDVQDTLITMLSTQPEGNGGVAPISGNVRLIGRRTDGDRLLMDLAKDYKKLEKTEEILIRSAIVETLTQCPDINYVHFLVAGEELTDQAGNPVGDMSADSFITNTGEELNSYARSNVTLYFTNVTGDKLKRYDKDIVYTSNMSMEKLVVESLISGPAAFNEKDAYPTLSPDTKLLSVTVKDRIAYVNFDEAVREKVYKVKEEVVLYSVVNSLVALPGIDKVQISVEGSTEGVFLDHMKLDELYERRDVAEI
ncbi:MAG: GerMN domain-containing protein [Lachnospiraceae bacterium]|nr:GerMN domain-containing protein [Lachnospiraceae bacterium]